MTTPMNAARFEALLAAYGASASRWPHEERDAAEAFARTDPAAAALLAQADAIDALLFAHAVPAPSNALQALIIDAAPTRSIPRRLRLWWTGLAFAAAAASGALIGSAATAALQQLPGHPPLYEHDDAPTYDDAAEEILS